MGGRTTPRRGRELGDGAKLFEASLGTLVEAIRKDTYLFSDLKVRC